MTWPVIFSPWKYICLKSSVSVVRLLPGIVWAWWMRIIFHALTKRWHHFSPCIVVRACTLHLLTTATWDVLLMGLVWKGHYIYQGHYGFGSVSLIFVWGLQINTAYLYTTMPLNLVLLSSESSANTYQHGQEQRVRINTFYPGNQVIIVLLSLTLWNGSPTFSPLSWPRSFCFGRQS